MKSQNANRCGFFCLDYHYVRPPKDLDQFNRLIGTSVMEFKSQIHSLKNNYTFLSLDDVESFFYDDDSNYDEKYGLLITFDDGLSDHFNAAKILHENNIRGVFFIPSCIFEEQKPPNPTVIHYGISMYGISRFLQEYHAALKKYELDYNKFNIFYTKGENDPWFTITKIKNMIKYGLGYENSRKVILEIFDTLLASNFPDILQKMHLTKQQVNEMLNMGHAIGTHTHTHVSITNNKLTKDQISKEIIFPKAYFESIFSTRIKSFSYPFGDPSDCFSEVDLLSKTNQYNLVFTVENKLNTKETSPYKIGRYEVNSVDNIHTINNKLQKMILAR